ncbi:hypothetical protein [Pseudomonas viridiflava]|nr:hypothetical protein [Pseudomonas viridiflava]
MSKIFWSGTFFGAGAVLTWLIYSNIIYSYQQDPSPEGLAVKKQP